MTDASPPSRSPTPPPEIPPFFRIGPVMLIIGSVSLAAASMVLAGALPWSDLRSGFLVATMMTFTFGIPLFVILLLVQSVLGLIFMRGRRRAWWRTVLVLLPAALVVGGCLFSIVNLFPPERRARRELGQHLGGPLPASIRNVRLHYAGGIDPTWQFDFTLSPGDYEAIKGYRNYKPRSGPSASGTLQAQITGYFFYLEYDPASKRCSFQALNY